MASWQPWHHAILTFVFPAGQPGELAWKKAALCGGRKGISKPQVITLEPCGMEPACLNRDAALLHLSYYCCCSNTYTFACTESGKKFCLDLWLVQHGDTGTKRFSTHMPHSRSGVMLESCFMVAP